MCTSGSAEEVEDETEGWSQPESRGVGAFSSPCSEASTAACLSSESSHASARGKQCERWF